LTTTLWGFLSVGESFLEKKFYFLTKILHTTGVESPNRLHSLANLKLTPALCYGLKEMFVKVFGEYKEYGNQLPISHRV
jgi:hypothetical protein